MEPFTNIDGRTARGRAFKKLVGEIGNAVGGNDLSLMVQLNVENLAGLTLLVAAQRERIIDGDRVDPDLHNKDIP